MDSSHPELSSLDLLAGKSFASFDSRRREGLSAEQLRSLKNALEAAKVFAETPRGWLVFEGTYGCGKTHLAAAIANRRAQAGQPPLFVVVPDLLDHLRATFGPDSGTTYDRRFDEVRTTSLLVLDDLGSQSATPWAREKLHQLLNHRYSAQLPTVITVARESVSGHQIDARIVVRMVDPTISHYVSISAPAYKGSVSTAVRKGR
jgi:DNA replication protein DnaC